MKGKNAAAYTEFLGANVRRLREAYAISQAQIAKFIGTTARYVQEIEAGKVNATVALLYRLADVLGVEPAELLLPCKVEKRGPGRPTAKFPPWSAPLSPKKK